MNHWWEIGGPRDMILPPGVSSSNAVQRFLIGARVVKALNHVGYHDLQDEARPAGRSGRKAIVVAVDSGEDVGAMSQLINAFGFDAVARGSLSAGARIEPGTAAFGANVEAAELRTLTAACRAAGARGPADSLRENLRRTDAVSRSRLSD